MQSQQHQQQQQQQQQLLIQQHQQHYHQLQQRQQQLQQQQLQQQQQQQQQQYSAARMSLSAGVGQPGTSFSSSPSARGPSRKRARPSTGSDTGSDDDILSDSSGPPQTKVKVEEVGGFSIVSAASDLSHTACGLVQQGPPTS
jgi:hypothetical protein